MRELFTVTFFLLLLTFLSVSVNAQHHAPTAAGAKGLALGDTRLNEQSIYSIFGNQAGLTHLEQMSFTAFGENRFALADINAFSFGMGMPTSAGVFGLNLNYYGFENYNEQKVGLAYARKLAKNLSIGAQIDYLNLRIPEYGNRGTVTFELGLQAHVNSKVAIAAHVFSPFLVAWNENYNLEPVFSLGTKYQPSQKITLIVEAEKESNFAPNFKFGVDYQVIEKLALRVGTTTFPVQNSFGVGFHLGQLDIDVATVFHQVLGVSSGVSVSYRLK